MNVNWSEVVTSVLNIAVKVIITVCIPYLFSILRNKFKGEYQAKYLNMAERIICDAVSMVQQTYVDELKANGTFNAEAQAIAFNTAKDAAIAMMSEKMQNIIEEAVGDLETYVNNKIEASIYDNKNGTTGLIV